MKKCIITAIQLTLVWHATTGSFLARSETAIKSCSSNSNHHSHHHPLTTVPSGGGGESTIEETSSYTLTGTATDDIEIDHVPHRFEPRRIILPLQVIVGAAMMYVAVRLVQTIYPSPMQQDTITSGSATGISTFYMWQTTVSLSMMKQTKYNHPPLVGMYTLGSLLLMNTRRGMDAIVPIFQGLDNLGAGAILPSSPIVGWEQMLCIARALPGFCVCQIIEIGTTIYSIGAFLKMEQLATDTNTTTTRHPSNDNVEDKNTIHPTWYQSKYKYLGLLYTIIRTVLATTVSYNFLCQISPVLSQLHAATEGGAAAATAALTTTTYINNLSIEVLLMNALGVMYICLSAAQMCIRSVGKMPPMTYVMPMVDFAMDSLRYFITTYAHIFNMKAIAVPI